MYNIILGFGALAINECQGQCHLACALKSLIGYKFHQLTSVCKSVFSKHVTVQQQIVLGLMYSAVQHYRYGANTFTAKMSNTERLQNLLYIMRIL